MLSIIQKSLKLNSKTSINNINYYKSCFHSSSFIYSNNHNDNTKSIMLAGKATRDGTFDFINSSSLPLYHSFDSNKSGLVINPIIHGPPKFRNGKFPTLEESNEYLRHALLNNRSNCFYVYNYYSSFSGLTIEEIKKGVKNNIKDTKWFTDSVPKLLEEGNIKRNQVVTVAGLGLVAHPDQILDRLQEAMNKSGLDDIDIAIVEVNSTIFESDNGFDNLNEIITLLEKICSPEVNKLRSYGLSIDLEPYSYHVPAARKTGPYAMLSAHIEETMAKKMPNADIVCYPIAPSSAFPATYPMLDPNPETWNEVLVNESSLEKTRKYTRAAVDPFVCYYGTGKSNGAYDPEEIKNKIKEQKKDEEEFEIDELNIDGHDITTRPSLTLVKSMLSNEIEQLANNSLDALCLPLKSSDYIQDKVLRVILSVGIDTVIVDSEASAKLGKLRLVSDDLLPSIDTDDVFGNFCIPQAEHYRNNITS